MKKFLVAVACCVSLASFAATQFPFEFDFTGPVKTPGLLKITDGRAIFTIEAMPTLTQTALSVNTVLGIDVIVKGVVEKSIALSVNQTPVNIGAFSAGTSLNFWIANGADGARVYGDVAGLLGNATGRSGFADAGEAYMTIKLADGSSWYITVETTPIGQPLPGVLAALALGGGVVMAVRRRKHSA